MFTQAKNKEQGFSLIELLIVIVIIGVLAAIAVPNYIQARQSGNQASAIASLRVIHSAESAYLAAHGRYGTMAELSSYRYLEDSALVSGFKSQYSFTIPVNGVVSFEALASPTTSLGQWNHYFINETGTLRQSLGSPANISSPPLN
jgi:prepilin-type N-terminal cleavage/methylation domain-containing protein